ncbi:MAG: hypothetical protein ACK5P5_10665 [Pseudobdellovibrionaceae bacterium]
MEHLGLIHLEPHSEIEPALAMFPVWKTCLRQIVFVPADFDQQQSTNSSQIYNLHKDQDAMQFLIEVLCGLHSPLVGENEVFGQFKQFLEDHSSHSLFTLQQKWIQFTLQEVKKTRAQYAHLLGSKSYGSLLRKLTHESSEVSIFGTGQFAEEILTWLSHKKKLQMIGRNTDRLKFFEGKYSHLSVQMLLQPAHQYQQKEAPISIAKHFIIAASVSNGDLVDFLKRSHLAELKAIFDLRGLASEREEMDFTEQLRKNGFQQEVVFLRDLFRNMESQRQQNIKLIDSIKKELEDNIRSFLMRLEHRPLGWDDLCA